MTLFLVLARCYSLGFGGGAMSMVRQQTIRNYQWLTEDEYLDMLAVGNLLPGSNPVNLAVLIGMHVRGWSGAAAGFLASVVPGFAILLVIGAFTLDSQSPLAQGLLRGCAAAAVGLTLGNCWEMTSKRLNVVDVSILIAVALAVVLVHLSLPLTLLIFLPLALVITNLDQILKRKPAP